MSNYIFKASNDIKMINQKIFMKKFAYFIMRTKAILFISLILLLSNHLFAQADTSKNNFTTLDEIVVTSTRTATKLGNVAIPVTIINQKTIQQAGTLRLKDILQEQAGLSITNGFGAGVQMQGLNPDYTIILLNGEPLVGRTAGVLDINRISISNIKKIEIVKGPSSSLYGSEAMAGVINIITDNTYKKSLELNARYGFGNPDKGWILPTDKEAFKNIDLNISGSTLINKTGIKFSSNAYYIDGISYRINSSSRIPQPIWRLTNQLQVDHPLSNKTNLNLTIRNGYDYIKQEFAVSNLGAVSTSFGHEANSDWNIIPTISHTFNNNIKSSIKLYSTRYYGLQKLYFSDAPDSSYTDEFKQHFYRAENQTDFTYNKMRLTVGAGYSIDEAQSTRYDNVSNKKRNQIISSFAQQEWTPNHKFTLIAGLRYDYNKLFAAAFSPKLAIRYKPSNKISLNASIGRGFKAPDFRQLYLNFTNNAAGGYSVFGTIDAVRIIQEMQSLGQISDIKSDFYKLTTLTPEFSTGINAGGSLYLNNKLQFNLNLFRNDIEALIDVRQVATKSNGAQIFSYINVKNAYTEGIECDIKWKATSFLNISAGYQFLLTADKNDISNIKAGTVYTRGPDNISRLLNRSEYVGLPNRSKHLANIKFSYENKKGFFATSRLMYRSKWYVADTDGNGLYNTTDESANGYFLLNISAGRTISNFITINSGIDNVANYKDVNYLPTLQGRMIYIGTNIKLK